MNSCVALDLVKLLITHRCGFFQYTHFYIPREVLNSWDFEEPRTRFPWNFKKKMPLLFWILIIELKYFWVCFRKKTQESLTLTWKAKDREVVKIDLREETCKRTSLCQGIPETTLEVVWKGQASLFFFPNYFFSSKLWDFGGQRHAFFIIEYWRPGRLTQTALNECIKHLIDASHVMLLMLLRFKC